MGLRCLTRISLTSANVVDSITAVKSIEPQASCKWMISSQIAREHANKPKIKTVKSE